MLHFFLLFALFFIFQVDILCRADQCQFLPGVYESSDWHLCWDIDNAAGTINLTLSYPKSGYIGLGFGSSMVGSNAIIGWASINPFIGDYYLGSNSDSSQVVVANNTKLLSSSVSYESSQTTISFVRNLTVEGNTVPPINPNGTNNLIWSWGSAPPTGVQIQKHLDRNLGKINLATGALEITKDSGKQAHAALMGLGWGLFLIAGIVIARFGKGNTHWFNLHRGFQTIGLILVIIAWCIGVFKIGTESEKTHFALGTTAVILAILQPINAALRPHAPKNNESISKARFWWNQLHHWTGRLAILFAVINVYIGFNILRPGNGAVWTFSVGLIAWAALILYLQWRSLSSPKTDEVPLHGDQKTLMRTGVRKSSTAGEAGETAEKETET